MNEEPELPDAEKSMCWTCKFGICVRETEIEKMYHPAPEGEKTSDVFDFQEEPTPEIIEHIIEHKRVKTICYWRPDNIQQSPPILIGKVEQCNRYKKNT